MSLRFYLITILVNWSFFLQAQEVIQKEGLAKLWESEDYATTYAALYADAPPGTLVEVKNLKNDKIVIVEVVGKPEDSNKSNTLIYISQKVYERLESPNPLFMVAIKYDPERSQHSFVVDPILWKEQKQAAQNPFEQPFQPNLVNNPNVSINPNAAPGTQPIYHTVNYSERNIYDVARLYNIYDATKIAEWNNLGNNYALNPGQRLLIYTNMSPFLTVNNSYITNSQGPISESGFAEVIKNISNPKPFIALHRTAPVGTLIQITNQANGKSVIVTVIGSLNNASSGTIIQIAEAAYTRLAATQSKFPVQIGYMANPNENSGTNKNQNNPVNFSNASKAQIAYLPSDILTDKWWVAFHKTAPIGSYIQVKNLQNNQSVTFLVAGPLQGDVKDNQVMMQTGQAGIYALNGGEIAEKLPVTMELLKGVSEGNMERIVRDIANVFEEGVAVPVNASKTYKNTTTTQPDLSATYSKPITHIVQSGETIHQIASRYNIARSELRFWNNMQDENLSVSQALEIYLPLKTVHTVKAGESVESIANLYKVQPIQIELWNALRTPHGRLNIAPGQNLVLYLTTGPRPNGLQNAPQISQPQTTVPNPKPNNTPQKTPRYTCLHKSAPIGTLILVEKPVLQTANSYSNRGYYNNTNPFALNSNYNTNPINQPTNQTIYNNPNPYYNSNANPTNYSDPFAQVGSTNNAQTNYTLVRNSLIVEVVGKLPDTEENEDILIKLSEDAFQALTNEKNSLALKISYFEW